MNRSMTLNMIKRPLLIALAATFAAACASNDRVAEYRSPEAASWVGPAGPAGPAGATGAQGATGDTGAPGAAMAGPRGAIGPDGPAGMQGPVGETGARGKMAMGRAGEAGPVGATGAQGATGETGPQGSSIAGPAGPTGNAGPAGIQGVAGSTGPQGLTTVGPTGATGAAGPQGPTGAMGAQGPLAGAQGNVRWTLYRDFTFEGRSNEILQPDSDKARQIAVYMRENPSYRIAIDGQNTGRVNSVVTALTDAGVPAYKIQTSNEGDPTVNRNRRVAVMVSN